MARNIDLVNTSNTLTGINISGTISEFPYEYYTLVIDYSPAGSPNSKISHRFNNITLKKPYAFTDSATGLKPDTAYLVTASLYLKNKVGGTPRAKASMTCTTLPLTATFECTSKSSSVISVMLSEMPRIEYPVKITLEYARGQEPSAELEWTENYSVNVEAGESVNVSRMITGLAADTDYLFKVTVFDIRNEDKPVQIGVLYLQVSTLVYVPGADNVVPSFKRYIVVPKIDYVYLQAELNEPLADGMELHLYRSQDDTTYTDTGAITSDDLGIVVDANWAISGGVRRSYFKLVIVDANNIEHNMSEPLLITNYGLWWLTREAGDPIDLTAVETLGMADAILKLYDLDVALGRPDIGAKKSFYQNFLKNDLQAVSRGAEIKGGSYTILNDMYALAQVFNNGYAHYYPHVHSGDIITADDINTMFQEVVDAVNNYNVLG